MTCFGNTFLQYSQAVGGKLWYWVSLFGTPEEAQRYRVTMSLVARNRVSFQAIFMIVVSLICNVFVDDQCVTYSYYCISTY